MLSGLIASIFCGPITLITDLGPKFLYESACTISLLVFGSVCYGFTIFGCILGWVVSWGSEHGYYHVIMLPLIALGMEGGNFSVLGTFDSFCLCVPCAGVCFAIYVSSAYHLLPLHGANSPDPNYTSENVLLFGDANNDTSGKIDIGDVHINAHTTVKDNCNVVDSAGTEGNCSSMSSSSQIISPQTNVEACHRLMGGYNHHLRQGIKGTISNLFMGDYVEACYPYTLHNRWILLSVRISTAIAGGLIIGYLGFQVDTTRLMLPMSCLATHSGTAANYLLRSSAYLPLPLTIILATMAAGNEQTLYDSCPNLAARNNIIAGENTLSTGGIGAKLSHLMGVRVMSGPSVIVVVVMMSFFVPFLTTLIIYSSKKLKKLS